MAQGRVDPAMLDNPELRYATLDGLIQRRLLLDSALRAGVTVHDDRLKDLIVKQQLFQDETGKFSLVRYEQYLKSEGMTPAMFEARLRQDMVLQQFVERLRRHDVRAARCRRAPGASPPGSSAN